MSRAEASAPAEVFAALGDATRLTLVATLSSGGARSIASLSLGARQTRQALTKHLRVLERAGLVESVRAGRETRFALRPEGVGAARYYLETVSAQWDDALGRLRALVEE
jgi:DNA-binding transcriptional ArsR family regulator